MAARPKIEKDQMRERERETHTKKRKTIVGHKNRENLNQNFCKLFSST